MQLNRGTIILLGVCILIILGGLVLQDPLQTLITPPTPTSAQKTILPDDLTTQATQLIIRQGEVFTQVDRVDAGWLVTDATHLDTSRETHRDFVDGLLALMTGFEYTSTFQSDDLEQFGLQDTIASIQIQTPTETYTLKLGNANPDGDSLYMMINDDPTIYLMPTVFEFRNIMRLALEPPYVQLTVEATEESSGNLLFPDIFGYQITEFVIRDQRDGSFIRYTQGELGTWIVEGTVVNEDREIDHVQAAVNVSQFLFLQVEQISTEVGEAVTNVSILTLSMTTEEGQTYTMNVISDDEFGYVGSLKDGATTKTVQLDPQIVNTFIGLVRQPPYAQVGG